VETVEGEGRASTIPDQSFDPVTVVAFDADGGIDAEAARSLPSEHVGGGGVLEETVAAEVPEYADLNGSLERFPMVRCQVGGFTEGDNSVLVLGKHPVEDQDVIVEMGVEAGAEPV
jgi:hypothetical protein